MDRGTENNLEQELRVYVHTENLALPTVGNTRDAWKRPGMRIKWYKRYICVTYSPWV